MRRARAINCKDSYNDRQRIEVRWGGREDVRSSPMANRKGVAKIFNLDIIDYKRTKHWQDDRLEKLPGTNFGYNARLAVRHEMSYR